MLCFTAARFGTANDGTIVVQRCSGTEAKLYDCWYYAVGACPVVTVECNGTCSLMCQNGGTLNASLVSSSMIHACFIVKCDLTLEFGIKRPNVVALQVENILLFVCPASQYKLNLTHMHIIYSTEI